MAVMNPMGGGIDTDVQNRMMQFRNDPTALGQQAQKSGDILDLIAARRAADLVAEQRKMLALQMNGSPATVKDQVEKELVDGQKAEMRGPLQSLQGKTQGVAGVLQNQQRQQGAPAMAAAQGGIINVPAPNLNRMYNGGIVGYAGKEGSEVSSIDAYLKRLGIDPSRVKDATDAELANIKAAVELEMQKDRDKGAGLLAKNLRGSSMFMPDLRSEAQRLDDDDKADARGRSFLGLGTPRQLQGEDVINPPTYDTNVREAERLRDLKSFGDKDYVDKGYYNVIDDATDSYVATMNDPKFGSGEDQLNNTLSGYAEAAQQAAADKERLAAEAEAKAAADKAAAEVVPEGNGGFSPVLSKEEKGKIALKDLGLDKKQEFDFEPFMRKPEDNPNQSPRMTPEQQAAARPKPKTPVELLQERLDNMGGKKGIAGLVERFANTDFQKSYGGTGEALAQAGRDIAKTGKDEKAAERKFLEDQLGVQQGIEAEGIKAAEGTRQYDETLGQRIAEAKAKADQFTKTFDQSTDQFTKTYGQSVAHDAALVRIRESELALQELTAANAGKDLDAQTQEAKTQTLLQANDLIRKVQNDFDKLIQEEVSAIENSTTIDTKDKAARAEEWREKREAERNARIASVHSALGITGGGSGGSGGSGAGGGSGGFSNFEKE